MRVVPLLLNHYKKYNTVPAYFAFGFAAFLRFMKVENVDGKYIGEANGTEYTVTDSQAETFYKAWTNADITTVVENVLSDKTLWDADLTALPGFKDAVTSQLTDIVNNSTLDSLEKIASQSLAK